MTEINPSADARQERFTEENRRAEELISDSDLPAAAKILVDIIAKDESNYRAYNNIGIIAWMQKGWEDAYSMFKKAIHIRPDYADALINLFDAGLKLRRILEILPFFEKAVALAPDSEEIRIIRDSIVSQGDGIYKSERGLVVGVYNPRIDEAQQLIADGKLYLATEKLLKINDEEGQSAEVLSGLGVISYYQNRYEDAFTLFSEAIKLNPTSRDNFLNLLDAAKGCGKVETARALFESYRHDFRFLESIAKNFEQG
jgi:tetratricopeptide (TPR) repeat protein